MIYSKIFESNDSIITKDSIILDIVKNVISKIKTNVNLVDRNDWWDVEKTKDGFLKFENDEIAKDNSLFESRSYSSIFSGNENKKLRRIVYKVLSDTDKKQVSVSDISNFIIPLHDDVFNLVIRNPEYKKLKNYYYSKIK